MRDEFSQAVKNEVSKRVGMRCSSPKCRNPTIGPQSTDSGAVNLGVAAHITAASPGGARYDPAITSEDRSSATNAIWLCQNCAKIIDADSSGYSVEQLRDWKLTAEAAAYLELRGYEVVPSRKATWLKINREMPELISEMREDLRKVRVQRLFFLAKRKLSYNMKGSYFRYFYDEHSNLRQKILILENYGLVTDISDTPVERFSMTEELADYLLDESQA